MSVVKRFCGAAGWLRMAGLLKSRSRRSRLMGLGQHLSERDRREDMIQATLTSLDAGNSTRLCISAPKASRMRDALSSVTP